jgi:hypothetical protein
MDLFFHLLLLPVDAAALWLIHRRGRWSVLAALPAAAIAGAVLAFLLAGAFEAGIFGLLRLLTFGLFVHGPILLVGAGWLLCRRPPRVLGPALLAAAVLLVAVAVYAHWVEPRWLEVTRVEIATPKIERPLRLVVLADIQTDQFGAWERQVLDRAMAAGPDLILFPGDYLQIADPERLAAVRERFRDHLRRIGFDAPLGAYAVRGDVEGADWAELFAGTGVTPIPGTRTLRAGELVVTALSPIDSRRYPLALPATDRFHVVFGHAPDYALGNPDADLLIAGHTHGGQVRLPFVGPLVKFSAVPRSWAAGVTELEGGKTLVVSRGIGLERNGAPEIRFLCRPQLVVIDLVPAG